MSASAASAIPSRDSELDKAIELLGNRAQELARMPAAAKAGLLRECIPRLLAMGPEWVAAGTRAKGLPATDTGEEWLAGVTPTIRMARLMADSLEAIAANGRPPLGRRSRYRDDGRLEIDLFPTSGLDRVLFAGLSGSVLMNPGVDRPAAVRAQARFHQERDPTGGVSLVLGAGNVSSIPPMDCFTKLFEEGRVCLLKMSPVNEWVGPILERALTPLVTRGYLRIVYGGVDVGKYLVSHPGIDDLHITGSDRTHDLIVWGPPGPERERRKADNDPVLTKPITSELGNVSPVVIVPYTYSEDELWFQARNVVSMVTNNASFNCNAAKLLVTAERWGQREMFLDMVERALAQVPTRRAYYPGAFERYQSLVGGRDDVRRFGRASDHSLAWAFIRGVDSSDTDDPVFRTEPFCGVLSETTVGSADPVEFLSSAVAFLNDRVWGTLNATLVIHPRLESDTTVGKALERAIVDLRYGTVAVNVWPAIGYASAVMPWGGHQSATLANIDSGLGWVHNTYMLGDIDKSVVRGPLRMKPHPVWFYDHKRPAEVGSRMAKMEADPGWMKLPGLVLKAI